MNSGFHIFYLVSIIRMFFDILANAVIISHFFLNCNTFLKFFHIFQHFIFQSLDSILALSLAIIFFSSLDI
jgi:hypothetical protein